MGHFDYVLIKANEKLFAQEIEANAISSGFIEFDGKSFTSKRPTSIDRTNESFY